MGKTQNRIKMGKIWKTKLKKRRCVSVELLVLISECEERVAVVGLMFVFVWFIPSCRSIHTGGLVSRMSRNSWIHPPSLIAGRSIESVCWSLEFIPCPCLLCEWVYLSLSPRFRVRHCLFVWMWSWNRLPHPPPPCIPCRYSSVHQCKRKLL